MRYFLTTLLIYFSLISYSQSQKQREKAEKMGMEAISLMDQGNYDNAITLLLKAYKIDPDRMDYPYEIAYALYSSKLYKEAIDWLKPLVDHPDVNELVFQLLGNAYDELQMPDSAIYAYQSGLERFPNSGRLYLEQGIVEYRRENYDQAIYYWEQGIQVQPDFSSNYFWLGRTLADSDIKIWSILYGEIFMILEPGTNRTQEMSEILYDVYNNSIQFTSDTSATVSLNRRIVIDAQDFTKTSKIPFEMNFEVWMLISATPNPERTNQELDIFLFAEIRKSFIENWFANDLETNFLFDFHHDMNDQGVFDFYNYWLIMMGDAEKYKIWFEANQDDFDKFAEYFNSKKPIISRNNILIRKQF